MGDTASQPRAGIEERAVPGRCSLRSCPAPCSVPGTRAGAEHCSGARRPSRMPGQCPARGGLSPISAKDQPVPRGVLPQEQFFGRLQEAVRLGFLPPGGPPRTPGPSSPPSGFALRGWGVVSTGALVASPPRSPRSQASPDPTASQLRSLAGSPLPVKLSADSSPGRARP